MFSSRFKERLVEWAALHDNLTALLGEQPNFAADHAALGALLSEARELESRKDRAKGELRDVNKRRQDLDTQGRSLRTRLATGLRLSLGADNPLLLNYGIPPRPPRIRRVRTPAERAEQLAQQAAEAAAVAEVEAALRSALGAKARLTRPKAEPAPKP